MNNCVVGKSTQPFKPQTRVKCRGWGLLTCWLSFFAFFAYADDSDDNLLDICVRSARTDEGPSFVKFMMNDD